MKHYSQYLFAAAILLAAFMIGNGQKNGGAGHLTIDPVTNHPEMLAELSFSQFPGLTSSGIGQGLVSLNKSIPGQHENHESLNTAAYQTLLRIQLLIHLELKPDLEFQSGQSLHYPSRFRDLPAA